MLFKHFLPDSLLILDHDKKITYRQLLQISQGLVQSLPSKRQAMLNLCEHYGNFIIALAAASLQNQTSLLPWNRASQTCQDILQNNPDSYAITDQDVQAAPALVKETGLRSIKPVPIFATLWTSGSTGYPQAHHKTWSDLQKLTILVGAYLQLSSRPAMTVLSTVPPQHMFGFECGVLLPLQFGYAVWGTKPLFPAEIHACLRQIASDTLLVTTPLHLKACLESNIALPQVRLILSATSPLPPALAIALEARYHVPVYSLYGSTETGALAIFRPAQETSWIPLPGISISRQGARWYAKADHLPATTPLNDRLALGQDQRFTLLGRESDLIKIGGKRMSFAHLNTILLAVPGVKDGIFFLPDTQDDRTTRLVALAVAPGLTAQSIQQQLRTKIDAAFLPRPLYLVPALPHNETGKIPKDTLIKWLAELQTAASFSIEPHHPALPGHFPGYPLVPGVVIWEKVYQALRAYFPGRQFQRLKQAKFLAPVLPGEQIHVYVTEEAETVDFQCYRDQTVVACGKVVKS